MLRIVARQYPGIGAKTVEDIYQNWLRAHPEVKTRKKKSSTTSAAAERTA